MAEPIRVGINGFGVMGRYLLRALQKDVSSGKLAPGMVEVVAVNDMYPVSQLFPLLEHDSTYLGFPGKLETDGKDILVDGKRISMSAEKDTKQLHWADRGVDIVYESTGVFVEKPGVEGHFESGAKKVIFSAPSGLAEMTIVMGVNDKSYSGQRLVSNASCTTNCLAPLAQALYDSFGVYTGLMTTIHAYTADQRLVDSPHKDTARAYAAALNFLPTSTGAAKAIGKVISELDGKLKGMCIRGPVPVGSIVDLVVNLSREVSPAEVNEAIQKAATGNLEGTLEYRNGPVVSTMVLGYPLPSVFDASQTITVGVMAKTMAYYDNVAGYSHQALRLVQLMGSHQPSQ